MQTFAKLPQRSPSTAAIAYAIGNAVSGSSSSSTALTVARLTRRVEKAKKPGVLRFVAMALLASIGGCGRSEGVPDEQLGNLVVAPKPPAPIDVERAGKDPAELGRALLAPHTHVIAAIGPHTATIKTSTAVTEGAATVSSLDDQTVIEVSAGGGFHALYTNDADYGREAIFAGGKLYLRPRHQRWHEREPEAVGEPAALRDEYFSAIGAAWELLAPGAELTDRGAIEVAGRAGRKIEIVRAPSPEAPPRELLAQRKWRETRVIDAVAGEVILDAERGAPLAVKLTGAVSYVRDGRKFAMKVSVDGAISEIGTAVAITAPARTEVVATPERLREVDERDFLLQGIAPSARRADGTSGGPP